MPVRKVKIERFTYSPLKLDTGNVHMYDSSVLLNSVSRADVVAQVFFVRPSVRP